MADRERAGLAIRIRGQVQGVGFRPFVWRLAQAQGVTGEVINDADGVLIRVVGATQAFLDALRTDAPPLARIDAVETTPHMFDVPPRGFRIAPSGTEEGARTPVTPDVATCDDCLAEIRDPSARRHGYPFANCTQCGPRLSILDRLPYDRARTSMAAFEMCEACRAEYEDPGDRRFHAQPIACPACGPHAWIEADGERIDADPLDESARRLVAGEILAIKGIGGFHLACDATDAEAIARLRARKRRPRKPLALMAPLHVLCRHADPTPEELARLQSPAAPILLLRKAGVSLPDALAPGQPTLGWMLPYTPLHHLLFDRLDRPLVMTSGNLSGEPQAISNEEAREKLSAFADAFLLHDRPIRRRLDDSVERITPQGPMILRRGRGRVPETLDLPPGFDEAPETLALGGDLKSAICLTKMERALLSHHLGDLEDALSFAEMRKAITDYRHLFEHRPALVAADLHDGYRATRLARALAEELGAPLVRVQHHHAHLAACLAEHRWPRDGGRVVGLVLDGLGLGPDGTIWGGEVLIGDYADYARLAWLKPAPLIGGDAANRQPWRNLLARLDDAGLRELAEQRLSGKPLATLRRAAELGVNAPLSSSAGRLFDAFAAWLDLAPEEQSFEGEAAMALEALAMEADEPGFAWRLAREGGAIDPSPLFDPDALTKMEKPALAYAFHATLARAFAKEARTLVEAGTAAAVVLSGGCFQNALLLDLTLRELEGLPVLHHRAIPPNDGGLALGQATVAMARSLR